MKDIELKMRLKSHGENIKNAIESPFDITKKIDEMEMSDMNTKIISFNWLKKTTYGAAALVALFLLTFNCIPSLAYAASDIPILGDVVRIVTFGRFEVQEENYEAKITTPTLEGLLNKDLENRLNKELAENADAVIAAFENDIKNMRQEYGDKNFHLGVTADYIIKTDNNDILAVDFYITRVEASAATTHRFYNIDKKTGGLITLASLFAENADYVTPISDYIVGEMKEQNKNGTGYYIVDEDDPETFEKIKKDNNFYINERGNIVICFDEYEVAVGAQGSPEFEIPNEIVKDILH